MNRDSAQLKSLIAYHAHALLNIQEVIDFHAYGETAARVELDRLERQQAAPPIAEFKDILGNLVARGAYVPATNDYTTNLGEKVAHWNASLRRIVPVPLLRARLYSQNRRADPAAHARHLEQQRQRYAETHPAVQQRNPFVDY
jgi:hypothetical protein